MGRHGGGTNGHSSSSVHHTTVHHHHTTGHHHHHTSYPSSGYYTSSSTSRSGGIGCCIFMFLIAAIVMVTLGGALTGSDRHYNFKLDGGETKYVGAYNAKDYSAARVSGTSGSTLFQFENTRTEPPLHEYDVIQEKEQNAEVPPSEYKFYGYNLNRGSRIQVSFGPSNGYDKVFVYIFKGESNFNIWEDNVDANTMEAYGESIGAQGSLSFTVHSDDLYYVAVCNRDAYNFLYYNIVLTMDRKLHDLQGATNSCNYDGCELPIYTDSVFVIAAPDADPIADDLFPVKITMVKTVQEDTAAKQSDSSMTIGYAFFGIVGVLLIVFCCINKKKNNSSYQNMKDNNTNAINQAPPPLVFNQQQGQPAQPQGPAININVNSANQQPQGYVPPQQPYNTQPYQQQQQQQQQPYNNQPYNNQPPQQYASAPPSNF